MFPKPKDYIFGYVATRSVPFIVSQFNIKFTVRYIFQFQADRQGNYSQPFSNIGHSLMTTLIWSIGEIDVHAWL